MYALVLCSLELAFLYFYCVALCMIMKKISKPLICIIKFLFKQNLKSSARECTQVMWRSMIESSTKHSEHCSLNQVISIWVSLLNPFKKDFIFY